MSSDVTVYIRCLGCKEKIRFFRFYHSRGDVLQDHDIGVFIQNHMDCNKYNFEDIFGPNESQSVGFELIRENG